MKKNLNYARHLIISGLAILVLLSSCQDANDPASSAPDQKVNGAANVETNSNARSNSSTRLLVGFNWASFSQPYFTVYNPAGTSAPGFDFRNVIPVGSETSCMTVGDFNGDGVDEFIIGYNTTDGPRLMKVTGPLITNFANSSTVRHVVIYSGSTFWKLAGVAAADFDGDGKDELVTALNSAQGPALYKGDATSIGYAKIYQGAPNSLSVVAVAGGDFAGNGKEELVTAFNSSTGPSIYRSQGMDVGVVTYQGSTFWTIAALTAADFDKDGRDELITGFNSPDGPALYKGTAVYFPFFAKIYQGPQSDRQLTELTSGKFGTNCIMHVSFYSPTTGLLLQDHDGSNFGSWSLSWSDTRFKIGGLASGKFTN
jgi:hypothetical protein